MFSDQMQLSEKMGGGGQEIIRKTAYNWKIFFKFKFKLIFLKTKQLVFRKKNNNGN